MDRDLGVEGARILYLTSAAAIGGGNRSLLTLWGGLRRAWMTPVALCPSEGALAEACAELGVYCGVVEYPPLDCRRPLASWRGYRRWVRMLGDLKVDLVHANGLRSARSICTAARRMRLPLVCHVRYPPVPEEAVWTFRGLPKPDVFLFTSRSLQAQAGPHLARACPRSPQRVVYNAVDLGHFQPRPKPGGTSLRVGIIANLAPIKGYDDFLAMARLVIERGHECEFWIAGEDIAHAGYREYLSKRAAEADLNGHVKFLGFQRDVPALLSQLDIVVSSSHYESFGRSLIEAMACERPVVATRVGGVPEIVEDGRTGILVPPRSPRALAAAVEMLVRGGHDLRQAMGRAGRSRVETLFGRDAHVRQMTTLYGRLLTGGAVGLSGAAGSGAAPDDPCSLSPTGGRSRDGEP